LIRNFDLLDAANEKFDYMRRGPMSELDRLVEMNTNKKPQLSELEKLINKNAASFIADPTGERSIEVQYQQYKYDQGMRNSFFLEDENYDIASNVNMHYAVIPPEAIIMNGNPATINPRPILGPNPNMPGSFVYGK